MDIESSKFKCGEIFLSKTSTYIFVCWYCKTNFDNFLSFRNHNEIFHNELRKINKDILIDVKDEHLLETLEEGKIYEHVEIEKYEVSSGKSSDSLEAPIWPKEEYITENYEDENDSAICENSSIQKTCINFVHDEKILVKNLNFISRISKGSNHVDLEVQDNGGEVLVDLGDQKDKILLIERFDNGEKLYEKEHIKTNHEDKISYDVVCKQVYKTSQHHNKQKCTATESMTKNHNNNSDLLQCEDYFLCKECPRYFDKLEKLAFHKRSHKATCQICDKKYISLERHMKSEHPERNFTNIKTERKNSSESLQCGFCNKKFKLLVHLHKHELNHQNLRCCYCMKSFNAPILLKNHIRTHTGEKPFQCSECPAAFALKRNLTTHFIYKHTDDKPFECRHESGCGKTFKTEQLRNNHEKRHSQKVEFQCEICGMDFNVKAKLRMHHKKKHMDYSQRPHPCNFCDKKFVEKDQLREHERTHTGEKPLKCNLCSSSFAKKSSLREHKKLHSGEKRHVCKLCGKAFAQLAGYSNHMKNHP